MNGLAEIPVFAYLGTTLALVGLWYLLVYLPRCREELEYDLRNLRDDLFDFMWQNHLSYEISAYRKMRLCLNGFIRLASTGTLSGISIALRAPSLRPRPLIQLMHIPTADLDPKLLGKLQKVQSQLRRRVFSYLYLEGLLAVPFYPLLWSVRLLTRINLRERWQNGKHLQQLQGLALYFGELPPYLARRIFGPHTQV